MDTVRAEDGLALSSRNGYLSETERAKAPALQQALQSMAATLQAQGSVASKKALKQLEDETKKGLAANGWTPQYITVCRQDDLQPAKRGDQELVILAAAQLGKARLIDNLEVSLSEQD